MKPISLRIENFRSFRKEELFQFQEPGLHYMTGENLLEPRLDANGSGKSTVWDALCWLFFNKTTRGLRAGDVANWETGKKVSVTLQYDYEGEPYTVTRTWSPISWTLWMPNGEPVELVEDTSNLLLHHLQLDYVPFLHCILMAQQQPMFLDLPAKDKAALFSEVLGLDRWLSYSDNASKKTSSLAASILSIEKKLASIEGQLQGLQATDLSVSLAAWDKEQQQRIDTLEKEYLGLVQEAKQLKLRVNTDRQAIPNVTVPRDIQRKITGLNKEVDILREDKLKKLDIKLAGTRRDRDRLLEDSRHVHSFDVCQTCGQKISPEKKKASQAMLTNTIASLDLEIKTMVEEEEELRGKLKKLVATVNSETALYNKISSNAAIYSAALRESTTALDRVEKRLDGIELELEALEKTENPFQEQQQRIVLEIDGLQEQKEQNIILLDDLHSQYRCSEYWIKGFKEVRLQLIAASLEQLELEVNSCVTELGLIGWQLHFEIDRETKSGSIQKGFTVRVECPGNRQTVPWEAWSGGESQRLRLAATMGLANLIRNSTGTNFDLEVWDEPTQYISAQGVADLLDSMKARSSRERRQIWIVDHRSLGYGNFDTKMQVVKDQHGSFIDADVD